jgi:hypothetical protein
MRSAGAGRCEGSKRSLTFAVDSKHFVEPSTGLTKKVESLVSEIPCRFPTSKFGFFWIKQIKLSVPRIPSFHILKISNFYNHRSEISLNIEIQHFSYQEVKLGSLSQVGL